MLHQFLHVARELPQVGGLRVDQRGAEVARLLAMVRRPRTRNDDHGDLRRCRADVGEGCEPVHARHLQVGDEDIDGLAVEDLAGLSPVLRRLDPVAEGNEDPDDQLEDGEVVVDDEEAGQSHLRGGALAPLGRLLYPARLVRATGFCSHTARMVRSVFSPEYAPLRAILVEMRQAAGLTQRDLAQRLGREHSFVARIEQGDRRLDVIESLWICRACGANPTKALRDLVRRIGEQGDPPERRAR